MLKRPRSRKTPAARHCSNVFALLSQSQISEFKEAFTLIDRDGDGFIQKQDLEDILSSLGHETNDEELEEMLAEAPGNINFTMFLTLFGERMNDGETEETLTTAFQCLEQGEMPAAANSAAVQQQQHSGKIPLASLEQKITRVGEKLSVEEFEAFTKPFLDVQGNFDYRKYLNEIKLVN